MELTPGMVLARFASLGRTQVTHSYPPSSFWLLDSERMLATVDASWYITLILQCLEWPDSTNFNVKIMVPSSPSHSANLWCVIGAHNTLEVCSQGKLCIGALNLQLNPECCKHLVLDHSALSHSILGFASHGPENSPHNPEDLWGGWLIPMSQHPKVQAENMCAKMHSLLAPLLLPTSSLQPTHHQGSPWWRATQSSPLHQLAADGICSPEYIL